MVSQIYFFVPNLIGYSRIILAAAAIYFSFTSYTLFFICYALSQILDQWDGYAARYYDQCSKFGAVLDMVTDRASTAALLVVLAHFYPQLIITFAFLTALDIMSHYAHLYASLSQGHGHKDMDSSKFTLLRIYYKNRYILYLMCFGNEATFLLLYLAHFWQGPVVAAIPEYISAHFHTIVPFIDTNLTLVGFGFLVFLPICVGKQFMNGLQMVQAAKDLVAIDEAEINKKH